MHDGVQGCVAGAVPHAETDAGSQPTVARCHDPKSLPRRPRTTGRSGHVAHARMPGRGDAARRASPNRRAPLAQSATAPFVENASGWVRAACGCDRTPAAPNGSERAVMCRPLPAGHR
jgi:hypothetical protein